MGKLLSIESSTVDERPRTREGFLDVSGGWPSPVGNRTKLALLICLIVVVLLGPPAHAASPQGESLVVSPAGPYTTIAEALVDAQAGDRIEVHSGTYAGPLTIDKSVALIGVDEAVIDGGGDDSVVTVTAPDVRIEGFVIRNSGDSLDREDAGIVLQKSPRATIVNNRIENTLFGVYAKNAPETELRGNEIIGMDLPLPRRGDGIRFWESPNSLIAENQVRATRDCILWFSDGTTVRDNDIRDGRYGLHLMYDNDIVIAGNTLADNSVGAFLMYSRRVTLRENIFRSNRGPSGYGVGLKDMDRVIGEDNLFVSNRVGMYLDNSPWSIDVYDEFRHNAFAYNDIGASFQPAVKRNIFTENTFLENMQQVSVRGGGQLEGNDFTVEGQGNFWSDYTGYDANGDGLGDLAYQPRSLFESLLDRHSSLRLFLMSPAQQAIDMASKAFPIMRPEPKLTDSAPLMSPVLPAIAATTPPSPVPMLAVSSGVVLLVLLVFGLIRWQPALDKRKDTRFFSSELSDAQPRANVKQIGVGSVAVKNLVSVSEEDECMIEIQGLTKRFGDFTAVDDFDLTVRPGEAVALWGPNGAGKTTIIKCLLGLLNSEGTIIVNGHDLESAGKAVRRSLGYVPQELALYADLTARESVKFYARLKDVPLDRADRVLADVGLAEHASKRVAALSGGMKQRLALGLALLANPPLLILDEPTSNLDARARDDFLDLLVDLKQQGKTMLFTSHRLEEVETLADRVLALEQGRVRVECTPRELATELGLHVTLKVYLPDADVDHALATLEAQGFTAGRNGAGVRVRVTPTEKAAPIQALSRANITVENFEIENGVWN
ncbi:MAG: putative ABC transporter binding protein NosD [Anaerolineales bacterium]|nr:putative ABC transporter binding protein NosD [Anaerolineales bacterium]